MTSALLDEPEELVVVVGGTVVVVVVVVVVIICMVTVPGWLTWQVTVLPLSTVVTPSVVHELLAES